jgi:hypothetical protein
MDLHSSVDVRQKRVSPSRRDSHLRAGRAAKLPDARRVGLLSQDESAARLDIPRDQITGWTHDELVDQALLGQSLGSRGEVALDRAGELRGAKAARGADRQGDKKVPHGTQNLFSQLRVHWMGLQVQEKYNTQPSM